MKLICFCTVHETAKLRCNLRLKATDPIEHGFRFWRQGGEGVVVVGLPEHLQLRGRLPLLTGSAHCRGTGLGTQLVQTRPGGDAVGESEKSYT